jgi:hypothetical protein
MKASMERLKSNIGTQIELLDSVLELATLFHLEMFPNGEEFMKSIRRVRSGAEENLVKVSNDA